MGLWVDGSRPCLEIANAQAGDGQLLPSVMLRGRPVAWMLQENYPPAPYMLPEWSPGRWDTWSPWREGTLNVSSQTA